MADDHSTPDDETKPTPLEQPTSAPSDGPAPLEVPTPTPADTPARPKGAGWDDDEDQPRDHGPRPEVPNHGARPVLIGIPILLITIAAIVAIVIAKGGGDDSGSASAGASGSAESTTAKAVAAIKSSAQLLAGRSDPTLLADVTCEPTDGSKTDFRCAYGADGDPDGGVIRVRLQSDGTVTKILGTDPPVAGQPRSDAVQTWLVQDDAVSGAAKVRYGCATSTQMNLDGGSTGGDGQGQRCVMIESKAGAKDKLIGQRYLQFAPDGTATRDFLLPPE